MDIHVVTSTGAGLTEISAFDEALYKAGVHNLNLIPLSSVIPPETHVQIVPRVNINDGHWGKRLYCVMSRHIGVTFSEEVWAGLGWVQTHDGRGLFVEHHAESQQSVKKMIDNSLNDMIRYRSEGFGEIQYAIVGAECIDRPVCALAIATYQIANWDDLSVE